MSRSMTTATVLLAILALPAAAEGDPSKGEKVFNRCKACHAIGDGAKNKVGPALNGIVDAAAGANPDFKYSDALLAKADEGLIWDQTSLAAYLTNPKEFIPKTKMSFPGLRKEDDIQNLIAYLSTFRE